MTSLRPLFAMPVGDYRLPDFAHITDADWLPSFEEAMAVRMAELEAIAADTTAPSVEIIARWERAEIYLNDVVGAFWTAKDADTNDTRDLVDAQIAPILARHHDAIWLNTALYSRLVALEASITAGDTPSGAEDRWWLSEALRAFRRAGIDLDEAGKTRLRELNELIAARETEYSAMVVKGRTQAGLHYTDSARLVGLNADQLAEAERVARSRGLDGWVIDLVNTTRQPILACLDDRQTRREVFEASIARGSSGPWDTRETILALVRLRDEKARLLGFPTYAAYMADDGCAKTTEGVMGLLTKAASAAMTNARREATELAECLGDLVPGATLEPWDWAWLQEKTRKARYDLDQGELGRYLSFETVLEKGVFAAATRLYGITFRPREDILGYTDECRTYEVVDADGSGLGLLQLDPYSRPTKQGGAWMTSLTEQGSLTGDRPVVTNNCNQTRPSPGQSSPMSWDEVTTLFHEFGHDLHGLFANTAYPSLSGTNTPRDFVEFPSQVNEMWAWEPSVIAEFARDAEGQSMPPTLQDTLLNSRSFGQGFDAVESFAAMLLDQAWHQAGPEELPADVDGIEAFEQAALARFGMDFPLIPPRYRSCYFSHIWGPGYAAGYYGYLWAEVMDADTVAWFAENGGLTRENGDAFRRGVLSVGGSCDVMDVYRAFRGSDPDPVHLFQRRGLA